MEQSYHYTLDLKNCLTNRLESVYEIGRYIAEVCDQLNLHRVGSYLIEKFPSRNNEPSGVTACQILSESALTIHSYPESGYIYIDLFSCQPYDELLFKRYTERFFEGTGHLQRVRRLTL